MDNYKTNNNTESIQLPEGFDWVFYVNNYPDLQKAGINTKEKAIQHYLEFGKKEGRQIYPTQQTLPKYYLSICAIIKDEGPYLQEWIEFHKLVGVEHFYIYDNNSTDNTKQILQPYINDKTITYTFWPMHPGQIEAYNDCLKNYGKESKWIAFIDLDEFLYSPKEDDLKKVIIDYEQYPAIGVNWVCFGSNNIEKKTDELVIKRFTKRAFLNFPPNRHIKSIVQSILTECAGNTPHQFIYKNNSLAVDENFNFIQKNESLSKNISINKIRINHYLVKSKEECENKLSRGRATIKDNRKEDYFKEHNKNDEEDLIITRFLPELKDALNKKKISLIKYYSKNILHKLLLPKEFDWKFYTSHYRDLKEAGIKTQEQAINHYLKYGKKEGRQIYPTQQTLPKYYLSICITIQNEGPYLQEWIEFHKLVGVEHFYIYDNNSTDNTKQILQPYINDQIVTYTPWPENTNPQLTSYSHWLKTFKQDTFWIAIIDADEFLFGVKENDLKKILTKYEMFPGVSINCLMFGSSNHFFTPTGLVIKNYTMRPEDSSSLHKCIKSIHNTNFLNTNSYVNPHFATYPSNLKAVNEYFEEIILDKQPPYGVHSNKVSFDIFRINHYKFKSIQDSVKKSSRITGWRPEYKNYLIRMQENDSQKQVEDLTLFNKFNKYLLEHPKIEEKLSCSNRLDLNTQINLLKKDLNKLYEIYPTEAVTILWKIYGIHFDLNFPHSLNEKILWLGINFKNKLIYDCVDKYECRKYVQERGCQEILPKLIGMYNTTSEIKFDELPNSFVLKGTVGCGQIIFCKKRTELDLNSAIKKMNIWLNTDYSIPFLEKYYKNTPRIICEEYLIQNNEARPIDYKIFCFNGIPRLIMVCRGRGTINETHYYFDTKWNRLNILKKENLSNNPLKPDCLKELLEYSTILSAPFPQVRVDFYVINNKIYFGEFTFTSAAGNIPDIKTEFNKQIGSWIELPNKKDICNDDSVQQLIEKNKKLLNMIEQQASKNPIFFKLPLLK